MAGTEPNLSAELVAEPEHALALAGEWRRLAELRGNAFVTPEWFEAAAHVYGDEAIPLLIAVRDGGGALRGALPLAVDTSGRPRALRFAGSGLGDEFHPACAEEDEEAVAAAAGAVLDRVPASWSTIVLENVPGAARWHQRLRTACPSRLTAFGGGASSLPYTELAGRDWDGFLADRSRSFRNQVGRKLRRLERAHDVRFRRTDDPAETERDIRLLFELHRQRWEDRAGRSSITERAERFHLRFSRACAERRWLRLYVMEIDGRPTAAWYGWRLGGRFAYYQAGLSPEHQRHSPGFLLLAHAMREAFEERASSFELLLGDEPFKSRFAETTRQVRTVTLARAAHPARLAVGGDAALRAAGRRLPRPVKRPARAVSRALARALPGGRRR